MSNEETYAIAFSVKHKRPGCILIQAALGGSVPNRLFYDLFPAEVWIAGGEAECPGGMADMKVYPATEQQLKSLSIMAAEATTQQLAALKRPSPSR